MEVVGQHFQPQRLDLIDFFTSEINLKKAYESMNLLLDFSSWPDRKPGEQSRQISACLLRVMLLRDSRRKIVTLMCPPVYGRNLLGKVLVCLCEDDSMSDDTETHRIGCDIEKL